MSDAASLVVLAGAVVVALSALGGAFLWLVKPRIAQWVRSEIAPIQAKVNETHTQVTQNGHRDPDNVTIRDLIGDIKREQAATNRRLDDHILIAEADSADLARVKRHLGI